MPLPVWSSVVKADGLCIVKYCNQKQNSIGVTYLVARGQRRALSSGSGRELGSICAAQGGNLTAQPENGCTFSRGQGKQVVLLDQV